MMIRFNRNGAITDARTILSGTYRNCSGGATPWGTWLSCEEISKNGRVYECDPFGVRPAVAHEALGRFGHEAAVVDPATGIVYMTEDQGDGGLYRFIPNTRQDLSAGRLQVMTETSAGRIGWANIPDPRGRDVETRFQVGAMKIFNRGEGAYFADGQLVFATTGDDRVWTYRPSNNSLNVIYDKLASNEPVLNNPDNVVVDGAGDVFVCEDGDNLELVLLPQEGGANPFARLEGQAGSEITGVAFNPAGTHMYFSSQRNPGTTYEITGPFRGAGLTPTPAPAPEPTPEPSPTTPLPADGFACTLAGSTLSWTDQNAPEYFIRSVNNGVERFIGETTSLSYAVPGSDEEYIVRYFLRGQPIDTRCAGNPTAPTAPTGGTFACSLAGTQLSWSGANASEYFIRAENNGVSRFIGSSRGNSFTVTGTDETYIVRYWVRGQPIDTRCAGNGTAPTPTGIPLTGANFSCSRNNRVLRWTDQNAPEYFIRAESNGRTTFLGSTSDQSFRISGTDDAYVVRYWRRGVPIDTRC